MEGKSLSYVDDLIKLRKMIIETGRYSDSMHAVNTLDNIVSNFDKLDFSMNGREISQQYNKIIKDSKTFTRSNHSRLPQFPKFSFKSIKAQHYDLNIEGTSKYYPEYPEWMCKSLSNP